MTLPFILGIVLAAVIAVTFAWLTIHAVKRGRNTPEAICKRIAFCGLLCCMALVAELLTYTAATPLVQKDGKLQYTPSPAAVNVMGYGAIGVVFIGACFFAVSRYLRRQRLNRTFDTYLDHSTVIRQEYGDEEAGLIMRRAGHEDTLLDERFSNDI